MFLLGDLTPGKTSKSRKTGFRLCGDLLALTKTNFANQPQTQDGQKVAIHSVFMSVSPFVSVALQLLFNSFQKDAFICSVC